MALPEVFPGARHLAANEVHDLATELISALPDAAELDVDANAHEVIAGWRSTARIKADNGFYAGTLEPTSGGFGPVEAIA